MIKKLLRKVKRRYFQKPYLRDPARPGYWFDRLIGNRPAILVQIGSNDGKTGDPLYPLFQKHAAWKGLLVEPIPYIFNKLEANYPDRSRFQLANVAIGENGELPFYYVDKAAINELPNLPYWYDQLGSFDRGHITKELDGVLTPHIRSMQVTSVDLSTLFGRFEIKTVDILHIDAEGYDWRVLQQLDLNSYQPIFILFEFHHLSQDDQSAALHFLGDRYEIYQVGIDWLAVNGDKVAETDVAAMDRQFKRATPRV